MSLKHSLSISLILLSGCASQPSHQLAGQQQQAQLQQLTSWQINASIAAKNKDQGWQARLLWRYQPQRYHLRINAPLGQGAFSLSRHTDGSVSLKTADGRSLHAQSAEQLLKTQLGLALPLSALPYWIKGQIAPNLAIQKQKTDPQGRLQSLNQAGWQIDYSRYKTENIAQQSYQLPHQLYLKKADYFVKLVISNVAAYP